MCLFSSISSLLFGQLSLLQLLVLSHDRKCRDGPPPFLDFDSAKRTERSFVNLSNQVLIDFVRGRGVSTARFVLRAQDCPSWVGSLGEASVKMLDFGQLQSLRVFISAGQNEAVPRCLMGAAPPAILRVWLCAGRCFRRLPGASFGEVANCRYDPLSKQRCIKGHLLRLPRWLPTWPEGTGGPTWSSG
ncbi:hypothetical protein B296_00010013 [Ensete ventricosum]|uniref:FBD domain-containing protein n=1 Tax=Ensete ventricosum TaxID=4639 RepID=A0A427A0Q0_ENSVE|nr:hypothetical protein B296_00010013 [Ensete ventricosum]